MATKTDGNLFGAIVGGCVGFLASGGNPFGLLAGANAGRALGNKLSDDDD